MKLVAMVVGVTFCWGNALPMNSDKKPDSSQTTSRVAAELARDASSVPHVAEIKIRSIAKDKQTCQDILRNEVFESIMTKGVIEALSHSIEALAHSTQEDLEKNAVQLEINLAELENVFRGNEEALRQLHAVYAANNILKGAKGRAVDLFLVATVLGEVATLLDIVQKGLAVKLLTSSQENFGRNKSYLQYALLASIPVLALINLGNYLHWWVIAPDMTITKLAEKFTDLL